MDYPIYDGIEIVDQPDQETDRPFLTPMMEMPDFSHIPFSSFPMMKPHEFINLISEEQTTEEEDQSSFSVFKNPDRPESIPPVTSAPTTTAIPNIVKDDLASFVDVFREEEDIKTDVRPARRPQRPNPNHRYPLSQSGPSPTPFTVRPKSHVVDHSYIRNTYKHQAGNQVQDQSHRMTLGKAAKFLFT